MSNKDLFKQAIAEAKSVREAAIANAKEALEETLTPHIKDLLAAKLQEMDEKEDQEDLDSVVSEGDGLSSVKEAEEEYANDDSEESEEGAEEEPEEEQEPEEVEGDGEIGDLTVDQFKEMIKDIIAQEIGGGDLEGELGDDLDAGEPDGMGDEEIPIEDPMAEPDEMEGEDGEEITVAEEEINIDEILAELESEDVSEYESKRVVKEDTNTVPVKQASQEVSNERYELKEALKTIAILKKDLQEVNILNSKLLYVNKIFKANNLTESQKVNIISAFDKAETVKEVKLVYETVAESIVTAPRKNVTESKLRGSASRAGGIAPKKPEVITQVNEAVRRMQVLAGIIKD
jgi:hypothetical protein